MRAAPSEAFTAPSEPFTAVWGEASSTSLSNEEPFVSRVPLSTCSSTDEDGERTAGEPFTKCERFRAGEPFTAGELLPVGEPWSTCLLWTMIAHQPSDTSLGSHRASSRSAGYGDDAAAGSTLLSTRDPRSEIGTP